MEPRQLLSATVSPIHVGATYFEDSDDYDQSSVLQGTDTQVADLFEVSYTGGADGTELTTLTFNLDNTLFDTSPTSPGAYGSFPLTMIGHDGFSITSSSVADGGESLVLTFSGFDPGEKLVFSVDIDEQGNLQPNAVAEGAELEGATMTASFTAPHMEDITTSAMVFLDEFDFAGTGLETLLPNDDYDNAAAGAYVPDGSSPGPVYTAGASTAVRQTFRPITLSGTVFEDLSGDNQQQTGEPGIGGVELTLYESVGGDYVVTGMTTTTNGAGDYEFEGLSPATYRVVETQPIDYLSVGATAGTVDGTTRGVVTTVDILSSINLNGGEDSIDNDFAETRPADLSGHVYHDRNNNGAMDSGEEGIGGVHLIVEPISSGSSISGSIDTYTLPDGSWSVEDLMPGQYRVTEIQPDGWMDGLDVAGTAGGAAHNPGDMIDGVYLVSGQSGQDYDFGELLSACVSGYVYVDANNNGAFDSGEEPIAGAQLTLLDALGNPTGETRTTNAAGFYSFCALTPGVYGVAEAQPAGYYDGLDAKGTAGGTAHNPGDLIDAIPLASGVAAKSYNFGELLPASISGNVYADLDGNGALDSGEPLLAGVTIYLLDSSGGRIVATTTDTNGKYAFVDLKPGIYGVEEIQPAAYLDGSEYPGSAGGWLNGNDRIAGANLASGVHGVNYDFCEVVPAKISGYVFQDGPAIVTDEGDPPPYIPALRDGLFTSDDTPLAGVTLILCDASGVPLLDAHGGQITTITDANGYYEFTMLYPGMYSIVELQPDPYLSGIDTVGSNGGLVINTYSAVDPALMSTFAVDPAGSAIVQIWVGPGDTAVQYNFSEVLVQTSPPIIPPIEPPPRTPPTPAPMALPFVAYQPVGQPYYAVPEVVKQLMFGGSGGPGGYSWHLSVIDAGQPRHAGAGATFTQYSHDSVFSAVSWSGADLTQSRWILADQNGAPIRQVQFGMSGAIPVTGDWDGSGTTKVGVFHNGLWFLDLDGSDLWDNSDLWAKLGKKGDQPVDGDWNGDGKTDIGIFGPAWIGDMKAVVVEPGLPDAQNPPKDRPKNVPPDVAEAAVGWRTMKKGNTGQMRSDVIDHVFQYGTKGDRAVTGDWNGDGIHTIGIFRNGVWFLDMDGDGRWSEGDVTVEYGQQGDLPVVGDWTGDGVSKLGVYRNGTFHLDVDNSRQIDAHDKVFELGNPGDLPVAGDWTGDGVDEVGVYQDNVAVEPST